MLVRAFGHIVSCNDLQVIKYESVIHEFDPYFNYRVTQVCFLTSLVHFIAYMEFYNA